MAVIDVIDFDTDKSLGVFKVQRVPCAAEGVSVNGEEYLVTGVLHEVTGIDAVAKPAIVYVSNLVGAC